MVKDVYFGKTLRKSFARHEEVLEMPNLLEIQKRSYRWFLETGLREVFADVASIADYAGKFTFELRNGSQVLTATNDAQGKVTFEGLSFSKAGTYTLTLTEKAGTLDNVSYDETVRTITVTVEEQSVSGGKRLVVKSATPGKLSHSEVAGATVTTSFPSTAAGTSLASQISNSPTGYPTFGR